jgi:ADP-heptose:LPS heptosyltransferase
MTRPPPDSPQLIDVGWKRRLGGFGLGMVAGAVSLARRGEPEGRRAVILEPFGMGDLISLEPLVRQLRAAGWRVTIAARPSWRDLFPPGHVEGWCDFSAPWSRYESGQKYRLGALFGAELRKSRAALRDAAAGGVGIDPRGDVRSVHLLWLAGCRQVWSLDRYLGTSLKVPKSAARLLSTDPSCPRWRLNLSFFPALTNQPAAEQPPDLRHLLPAGWSPEERRVALIPVAPWRGKLWEPEKWRELVARLQALGWQLVGLCGPQQSAAARAALGADLPVTECDGLAAWAMELARSRLAVTLDTGPMHLAAALGVPLVALFGQGLLPLWHPAGARSMVVSHQADADFKPCHPLEENWEQGARFMRRITVAEVLAAVEQVTG